MKAMREAKFHPPFNVCRCNARQQGSRSEHSTAKSHPNDQSAGAGKMKVPEDLGAPEVLEEPEHTRCARVLSCSRRVI